MIYESVSGPTIDGRKRDKIKPTSPEDSDGLHCRGLEMEMMKVRLLRLKVKSLTSFYTRSKRYERMWIRFR